MDDSYKSTWTEKDYEAMNWHDVTVHGLSIMPTEYSYELLLDIDYIFEWVHPRTTAGEFSFMVAPATLAFNEVWDVVTNIETRVSILEFLSIQDIQRVNPRNLDNWGIVQWEWIITLLQGTIRFKACGYHQYLRRKAVITESQALTLDERGGLSFGKECLLTVGDS